MNGREDGSERSLAPIHSLATALFDYHLAIEKVQEAMASRDEAWAMYQRARDEQTRRLPQE